MPAILALALLAHGAWQLDESAISPVGRTNIETEGSSGSDALADATANIERCHQTITPSNDPTVVNDCLGEWRGIKYMMTETWRFEITVPSSRTPWTIMCHNDKVESIRACLLMAGANGAYFHVSNGPWSESLSWGSRETYPGSVRTAKIGDLPPMRFAEKQRIDGSLAQNMLTTMKGNRRAIFRYFAWPVNLPVDVELDLTEFENVLTLFHAAAHQFRTQGT